MQMAETLQIVPMSPHIYTPEALIGRWPFTMHYAEPHASVPDVHIVINGA